MKYISVEEFLNQPVKVQKVFLDWWKCDSYDLYFDNREDEFHNVKIINSDLEGDIEGYFELFKTTGVIPLLTECKLRKFIEDKTGYIFNLDYIAPECGYAIVLINYGKRSIPYIDLGDDVLQAYWKVATKIAKGGDLNYG